MPVKGCLLVGSGGPGTDEGSLEGVGFASNYSGSFSSSVKSQKQSQGPFLGLQYYGSGGVLCRT